jgi:predicted transposase YdaD
MYTKAHARECVKRALSLAPDLDAAIASTAQALGLDVEAVQKCWGEQEAEHA